MHFTSTCFQFACLFNKCSQQSVTCLYHYSISKFISSQMTASPVQCTSVSHYSLNFAAPCQGYGFLSIILVLENCKFRSLKVLEKSLNGVL